MKLYPLLYLIFFCFLHKSNGQPCGSMVKTYDYQQMMKDGRLVLLHFSGKGEFDRYTLISNEGKILIDSLNRKASHIGDYDPRYCISNSLRAELPYGLNPSSLNVTDCNSCWCYIAIYTKSDELIIGRFRINDPKNVFISKIDSTGSISEEKIKPETIGLECTNDDVSKYRQLRVFLENKYDVERTESNGYLYRFDFEKQTVVKLPRNNMRLEQQTVKAFDAYSSEIKLYKWKLIGSNWEYHLDGDLIAGRIKDFKSFAKGPLIVKDQIDEIYITVYNQDMESCPGYGRDIYPIVYKFNIRLGIKIWELHLKHN